MKNITIKTILTCFFIFHSYGSALCSDQGVEMDEIDFLLRNIEQTECVLIRNGKSYGSEDALEHVQKKYIYFKDKIETAEEFIEISATKSLITGKYYYIECQDQERIKFSDWLYEVLNVYRAKQPLVVVDPAAVRE